MFSSTVCCFMLQRGSEDEGFEALVDPHLEALIKKGL